MIKKCMGIYNFICNNLGFFIYCKIHIFIKKLSLKLLKYVIIIAIGSDINEIIGRK